MQEKNNSTGENNSTQQQERHNSTQHQEPNNSTQQHGRNNSPQQEKPTQLVSRNETTQLCNVVDRLQPPAPPLQQNRFFYLLPVTN
ncbi:hypothetical protein TNCV_3729001 [Trichonephila clavipes]|nr:hypothetical protein TNCV_3729001 [Trichonephila clavipes]